MNVLFLGFLTVHLVHALSTGRDAAPASPRRTTVFAALTQVPVFVLACYLGAGAGVFSRDLVSPVYILLGLLAGHAIFGLSLLMTHRNLRDSLSHFFDVGAIWNYGMESPIMLNRFLMVGVAEELIWRVAAQPILIGWTHSPWLGIGIVALSFSLVHRHFLQNPLIVSTEFLCFAILLGVLYYVSGSLILVIVIHAVRDIEIAYLEYLIKVEELGDAQQAVRVMEQAYWRRPPENT